MSKIENIDIVSQYAGKTDYVKDGDNTKAALTSSDWNGLVGALQTKINELAVAAGTASGTASVNASAFFVNGVLTQPVDGVVALSFTGTSEAVYELEGTLYGHVTIQDLGDRSVKKGPDVRVNLNGVSIISPVSSGISFELPSGVTSNDNYGSMTVNVNRDTVNNVICTLVKAKEDSDTACVFSCHKLNMHGVGYLALVNKGAHAVKGTFVNWAGPRVYAEAVHDAIHGSNGISLLDGSFHIVKANDAFGTGTDGMVNIFRADISAYGVAQNVFDGKAGVYRYTGNEKLSTDVASASVYGGTVHNVYTAPADVYGTASVTVQYTFTDTAGATSTGEATAVTLGTDGKYTIAVPTTVPTGQTYTSAKVTVKGYITAPFNITATDVEFAMDGAYIKTGVINSTVVPSVYYTAKSSRLKVRSLKSSAGGMDTVNVIINDGMMDTLTAANQIDIDCVKSENNLSVELKGDSVFYVSCKEGDGLDASEVHLTDSKGNIVVDNCGGRGIKATTFVIGPDASETAGVITYVDDTSADYTTFDGAAVICDNCKMNLEGIGYASGDTLPDSSKTYKDYGYADVYCRNGKYTKGQFGTVSSAMNGCLICGSIAAWGQLAFSGCPRIYYSRIVTGTTLYDCGRTYANWFSVPYMKAPVPYKEYA